MRGESQSMRALSAFFFIAILAASSVGGRAADKPDPALDAPPAGLVHSDGKLSAILAEHEATVAAQPKSSISDWTFVDTGLHGSEHLVRSGTDYHSIVKTDAGVDEYGQNATGRWHRDASGFSTPTTSTDERSFYQIRVDEEASDPKNDVSLAGETAGPNPAYVVKVTIQDEKHPEWVFFDKSTSNIVRVEKVNRGATHRMTETFDDFRTAGGMAQAWHVHDAYWESELDDDYVLTSYKTVASVPAAEFVAPKNPIAAGAAVREKLPAQFVDGSVIVRMTVGGRGLDFEIDPSYRHSYIDYDVARELHLSSFGRAISSAISGNAFPYETVLPDASIGPIVLHDFPVFATDVAWQPNQSTKVVGTLGYDFLAANVIHVDYLHHLVEVLPTSSLPPEPAKPIANALDLPVEFDDGAALVPMAIGDGFTEHAVFDPGMPFSMVVGEFAAKHVSGDATKKTSTFVPFADDNSYGKSVDVWIAKTSVVAFANLNITNLPILATDHTFCTCFDAFLGYDYLQFYDIYFDYPHDRLLVVPNDRFYKMTGKPKPSA